MRVSIGSSRSILCTLHRKFFLLFLILLPTQLGFHTWPSWSLILGRRVDYLSPTLYLTDVILFLTLCSFVCCNKPFPTKIRGTTITLCLLASVIFLIINTSFSIQPATSLYGLWKLIECSLLVWYIYKSGITRRFILKGVAAAIIWSVLLAIGQLFLQRSLGGVFWFLGERTFSADTLGIAKFQPSYIFNNVPLLLRPYGTFPHPNVLGGFFVLFLPFYSFLRMNKATVLFIVFILVGIVATFSRSVLVLSAAVLSLRILSKYNIPIRKYMFPFSVTTALLLTLVLFIPNNVPFCLQNDESFYVRSDLARASFEIWQQSPFLGTGLGTFLVALPRFIPTRTISFLQPVHNNYLLILTETGLFGFFVIMCLILFYMKYVHAQTPDVRVSFCVVIIIASVDHYLLTLQQGQLMLSVLIGIMLLGTRKAESAK